jgi:hypothetical protein
MKGISQILYFTFMRILNCTVYVKISGSIPGAAMNVLFQEILGADT